VALTVDAPASVEAHQWGVAQVPPQRRLLGALDQAVLWGSLGVSLLLPVAAVFVLRPFGLPELSPIAALTAIVATAWPVGSGVRPRSVMTRSRSARASGPAARVMAPSTPPPGRKVVFAAFTIASTDCVVISPCTSSSDGAIARSYRGAAATALGRLMSVQPSWSSLS